MRYAKIKLNDSANTPGICVSVYLQGCARHCYNCFNPETWDFAGGADFTSKTLDTIKQGLTANGIQRSLAILGGEPLHPRNEELTNLIIQEVKKDIPNTKIYIWTGYTLEELLERQTISPHILEILSQIDFLIDGPYIDELRDITLTMRGSSNQRIINMKKIDFSKKI